MVRSHSISGRAPSRRIAVSALTAAITLAIGHAHSQTVSAQSVTITGRAPIVTIGSITNQTVPGQAPAVGHVLHVAPSVTDPDNDAITATNIRWKRGATEVGTGADYATTLDDAGQTLTLEVEATTDAAITDPASQTETSSIAIVANTRPTATPTISYSGDLTVGTVLTANPNFVDLDNDLQSGTTYQWCSYGADGVTSTGCAAPSTSATYTVAAVNVGDRISVKVIPKSATGTPDTGVMAESAQTDVVGSGEPTASPAIEGNAVTGATLTARSGFQDPQNDLEGATLYQWCSYDAGGTLTGCGTPSTNNTLVLTAANLGYRIAVRVTPKAATGTPDTGEMVESTQTELVVNGMPTATPTITGDAINGATLTAHSGFADPQNDLEGATLYQWCSYDAGGTLTGCGTPSTNNTLVLTAANLGYRIAVRVTPKAATGTPDTGTMVESAQTEVVIGRAPTATPTISYSGDLTVGTVLTANPNFVDLDNDLQSGTTYQWCSYGADGVTSTGCAAPSTSATYTVAAVNVGDRISVKVIPKSATGTPDTGVMAESAQTDVVGSGEPTASPAIEGNAVTGATLTARSGFQDPQNDLEGATLYQWCSYDAGGTLTGCGTPSTNNTLVLTAANLGYRIAVRVTPKSATGTPDTGTMVESAQTDLVVNGPPTATPTITGDAIAGSTLTAHSGFQDPQGDLEGDTLYQWCSYTPDGVTLTGCGTPATTKTLPLTQANANYRIVVRVTPKSATGTPNEGATVESAQTAVVTPDPDIYTVTGPWTLTGSNTPLNLPITVSNRSGNAPANLRIGATRTSYWMSNLKPASYSLIAPDGTAYPLAGEIGVSETRWWNVNASSETSNGTWHLRLTCEVPCLSVQIQQAMLDFTP